MFFENTEKQEILWLVKFVVVCFVAASISHCGTHSSQNESKSDSSDQSVKADLSENATENRQQQTQAEGQCSSSTQDTVSTGSPIQASASYDGPVWPLPPGPTSPDQMRCLDKLRASCDQQKLNCLANCDDPYGGEECRNQCESEQKVCYWSAYQTASSPLCTLLYGDPHYSINYDGKQIRFDHHGINGHTYLLFAGNNVSVEGIYVPTQNPDAPQVIGVVIIRFSESSGLEPISWDLAAKQATIGSKAIESGVSRISDGISIIFDMNGLSVAVNDGMLSFWNEGSSFSFSPSGTFRFLDGILGRAMAERRALTNEECEKFDVSP